MSAPPPRDAPPPAPLARSVRRALDLLDPAERRRWALLVPWMLVAATLEAAGAALVFALVRAVADPAALERDPRVRAAAHVLGLRSPAAVIGAFGAAVTAFYLVKNAAQLFTAWATQQRAARAATTVATRLFGAYLRAPWTFHLARTSPQLVRNVGGSVEHVYRGALLSVTSGLSELLMVAALGAVLMVSAPGLTLALGGLIAAFALGIVRGTQRVFARWGETIHRLHARILATLQQGLGGTKELRVLGREAHFEGAFAELKDAMSRLLWRRAALEHLPRLSMETLFVGGVAGVVTWAVATGQQARVVPLLGLFGYAGFRVLPAVQRLVFHVNTVRFTAAAIDELWTDWHALGAASPPADGPATAAPLPFTEVLRVEGVRFTYPGAARPALDGVDLEIRRGESIGLVGSTGAGKSTLVDVLLGLLAPDEGRLTVDGADVAAATARWQRQLGFVPQTPHLIDDTLRNNVALGLPAGRIDEAAVREAVRLAQLEPLVASLPEGLDTVVGERGVRLSGGERQRVAVARALLGRPEVLVFDEATSALDGATEAALVDAVDRLRGDRTTIVVAHRLTSVRRCDRIVVLEGGKVAAVGAPDVLRATSEAFRRLAGEDAAPPAVSAP